jgi:hypothetical protein
MKIENPGTPSTKSVERTQSESVRPATLPPVKSESDKVRLSGDLHLADVALRAAAMAGDVRPEAVAQAYELVRQGQLGNDLERLADRIIDSLIESRDQQP